MLTLCLLHGTTFLSLRTTGAMRGRAGAAGRVIGLVAIFVNVAWCIWTLVVIGGGTVPQPTQIFGVIAVIFATLLVSTDNDGWAFVASGFALAASIGQIFIALYPNVMVSSTSHAFNLTVNNAAAGHYGLVVMTVVAVLFLPIVLAYQGWSFHVFRKRVAAPAASPQTPGGAEVGSQFQAVGGSSGAPASS
jgi:cytochrome d ubiquinol oxidase subunit II